MATDSHDELHIVRNGQELGILTAREAHELLAAGFLKPTDDYWIADATDTAPLSRLAISAPINPDQSPLLARVASSAASAGQFVQARAADIAGRLLQAVQRPETSASPSALRALEDFLPQIRKLVSQKAGALIGATEEALHNDELMRKTFGAVYDCLPRPICRFVTESAFVEFCLRHKRQILK